MNLCSDTKDLQVSNRYQVDDDDAAIRTIQLDRMVNVADVALEAVSDRKEVAAEKAFEPDEQQKWRHLFFPITTFPTLTLSLLSSFLHLNRPTLN